MNIPLHIYKNTMSNMGFIIAHSVPSSVKSYNNFYNFRKNHHIMIFHVLKEA